MRHGLVWPDRTNSSLSGTSLRWSGAEKVLTYTPACVQVQYQLLYSPLLFQSSISHHPTLVITIFLILLKPSSCQYITAVIKVIPVASFTLSASISFRFLQYGFSSRGSSSVCRNISCFWGNKGVIRFPNLWLYIEERRVCSSVYVSLTRMYPYTCT